MDKIISSLDIISSNPALFLSLTIVYFIPIMYISIKLIKIFKELNNKLEELNDKLKELSNITTSQCDRIKTIENKTQEDDIAYIKIENKLDDIITDVKELKKIIYQCQK